MDKKQLRQYDFVWSIVLFVFSGWIFFQALGMPMKDTYAGVENVWYVSPALMPFIVSGGIFILSVVLFIIALKDGGARGWLDTIKNTFNFTTEGNLKFLVIVLSIISYVFIYLPRVDFFLCSAMFLFYLVGIFYFEDHSFFKKMSIFFFSGAFVFLIIFILNLHSELEKTFYFTDGLVGLFAAALLVYAFLLVRKDKENFRRFRIALILAVVAPLILSFTFRFMLLVPLPKEGAVLDIISNIYYSIKKG